MLVKRFPPHIELPLGAALAGLLALVVWLWWSQPPDVATRVPAPEKPEALPLPRPPAQERNTGTLIVGSGKPAESTASWPQFRGADRTNIVRDAKGLARSWPSRGPDIVWKLEVGEGHAGAAIHNGRVYLMDYDREKHEDTIRCLSLADGSEIWRYTYYVKIKRNHGMSRTVPAVNDDYVVTIGPKCHVTCLDARSGERVWKMDLVGEFGAEVPPWYTGQCPLIDGDSVILAPGGDPLMMAVDLATGDIIWKTPNPGGWGMTHSSIAPVDYKGARQYVYCTTKGVVGVSAADGRLLWTKADWRIALANVPSPVPVGEDRVFLSGGYNSGCVMIRIKTEGKDIETEELWRLKHTVFGAEQHTPILFDGHIYGVVPHGELACLDLDGNRLWASGGTRFGRGLGPLLLADGLLFVLHDQKGTLHLVDADPGGYKPLGNARLLEGHDAWAPMAMAGGRLILRDLTTIICVEVPTGGP